MKEPEKSITVGGVTYWATDRRISIGKADDVTVFVSNKAGENNC